MKKKVGMNSRLIKKVLRLSFIFSLLRHKNQGDYSWVKSEHLFEAEGVRRSLSWHDAFFIYGSHKMLRVSIQNSLRPNIAVYFTFFLFIISTSDLNICLQNGGTSLRVLHIYNRANSTLHSHLIPFTVRCIIQIC